MGRLYLKPTKTFVKIVQNEPRSFGQQWFVAAMFVVGLLTWTGFLVWGAVKLYNFLVS